MLIFSRIYSVVVVYEIERNTGAELLT